MNALASWTCSRIAFDGQTREVFRKGRGTGVIVIHEFPGIERSTVDLAERIVARGHTVLLPRLFGEPFAGFGARNVARDVVQFCVRREFSIFARGRTSPVAGWLRALARSLHDDVAGPGVGVVGMCFTGGFALAMLADAPVIAPVLAEPSLPAPVGVPSRARARGASLGLSPSDVRRVRETSCDVLGLRYRTDPAVAGRFGTLERELGDRFIGVEFEGSGHSVLTAHPRESGILRVLDFLDERLDHAPRPAPARDEAKEALVRDRFPEVVEAVVTHEPAMAELVVTTRLSHARARAITEEATRMLGLVPDIRFDRARARPRVG